MYIDAQRRRLTAVFGPGFVHTAFTFAYEGQLMKSELASAELPPGALIAYLQKGLQYVSIESQLNEVLERPLFRID